MSTSYRVNSEWQAALRACRERAYMSQSELAAAVGCSRQQINNLEAGRSNPSLSMIRRLREALPGLPSPFEDSAA